MPTKKLGLPLISGTMAADVPRDMNALAEAIDSKVGAAGGLATLGAGGKIPAGQLDIDLATIATKKELQAVVDDDTAHKAEDATLTAKGHVRTGTLSTTLDTAWAGSSAPFTKTQTVSGILATDNPMVDVTMSGTYATDELRVGAWGSVYRITTANNVITLYATEKPTVSLPIQLKVVR